MTDNTHGGGPMDPQATLFGVVRRLPVVGNLPVPVAELRKPLPDEDYALYFFCSGCGTILPVLKKAVTVLVSDVPASFENQYLSVARCDVCDDRFMEARVVPIPEP